MLHLLSFNCVVVCVIQMCSWKIYTHTGNPYNTVSNGESNKTSMKVNWQTNVMSLFNKCYCPMFTVADSVYVDMLQPKLNPVHLCFFMLHYSQCISSLWTFSCPLCTIKMFLKQRKLWDLSLSTYFLSQSDFLTCMLCDPYTHTLSASLFCPQKINTF